MIGPGFFEAAFAETFAKIAAGIAVVIVLAFIAGALLF